MADPNELDAWVEAQIRRESQWPSWDDHKRALTLLQEHRAVLRALFMLVEDGTLVRNMASDGAPGWAIRQIPLVKCLAETRAVLAGEVQDG